MKNKFTIIGILVIVAAGLYLFLSRGEAELVLDEGGVSPELLASTQLFIERSALLSSLTVDDAVLRDERFTRLRSFSEPIKERPVGRPNPFLPAERVGF